MKFENQETINRQALFADENEEFRIPAQPDAGQVVTLRFRTGRDNIDHVYYQEEGMAQEEALIKTESDQMFDYYEYKKEVPDTPVRYRFRVEKGQETCYYNRLGVCQEAQECFDYCITPGFHTPEWVKGAVMYQIFVDRFCNGDTSNDVQDCEYVYIGRPVRQVKDWGQNPSTMDVGCFYGGDLQGVWNKLDYLQGLGVEVIYFNPLFVSPSNHKYDTQDYDHIDPHYGCIVKDGGEALEPDAANNENASRYRIRSADPENLKASNEFFAKFVEEVHRRGMRVIMDGVFNHCGSFNKWLDREQIYQNSGSGYEPGAFVSGESPYRSFFKFHKEDAWPNNIHYDGWWGHDTLPKLNYEDSEKLYEYVMDIARKWVSPPYSVDGWRLDVAADLGRTSEYNHKFWKDFRRAVKEANPDAVVLAEHYGDPGSWLQGDQWDTVMNYDAFMEPVTWFLTGMEKHSDEYNETMYGTGEAFFLSMFYHMSKMQTQSVQIAMNELSNHDHSRFLTRTNRHVGRIGTAGSEAAGAEINKGIFREAVLIQMTWPGAPTVYYGDEAGVCGWTDPDNRRTYPWGKEDLGLIEFHRYMIGLHKRCPALRRGSLKQLGADHQFISYGRFLGDNRCVVAVNNREEQREITLPVWELGITDEDTLTQVVATSQDGYDGAFVTHKVEDGMVTLTMGSYSGILLISNKKP